MKIFNDVKISKILAANLVRLREAKGLSVVELAKILEITRQGVYQIEDGEHWISKPLLEKICKFYKIEEDVLFQKDTDATK